MLAVTILAASGCGDDDGRPFDPKTIPAPSDLSMFAGTRIAQAVENARKAVAEAPDAAGPWGRLGHTYMAHGWPEEAAQCYRQAARLQPSEFRWRYFLGVSLDERDPAQAAGALAEAVALDPDYAPAHLFYGVALRRLGRMNEAREHLRRAAELDPRNPLAELELGQIALTGRRFDAAREHLTRALDRNPRQSEAHAAMAQVCRALGDGQGVTDHARAATRPSVFSPMYDPMWRGVDEAGVTPRHFADRGARLLRAGQPQRAVTELAEATAGLPGDPRVGLNYATALMRIGRPAEAAVALQHALDAIRDDTDGIDGKTLTAIRVNAHVHLGIASAQLGDHAAAERHLKKGIELDPKVIAARNNLAFVYHAQGRLPEAIKALQAARRIGPDPKTLALLAAFLKEAGDHRGARAVEEELAALRMGPQRLGRSGW